MLENLDKEKKQLEKKVSTLEIITSQTKINANSSGEFIGGIVLIFQDIHCEIIIICKLRI